MRGWHLPLRCGVRFSALRRCTTKSTPSDQKGAAGTGEMALPSGAVMKMGGGVRSEEEEQKGKLWFERQVPKDITHYTESKGDKGYPFNSYGASEFPDTRSLDELDFWSRGTFKAMLGPYVKTKETAAKQQKLLMDRRKKQSLCTVLGGDEGDIRISRRDSVIEVLIIPARGMLTGGLMRQLHDGLRQIFSVQETTGVIFQLRSDLNAIPAVPPTLEPSDVRQAVTSASQIAHDLLNLPQITVAAVDRGLHGAALELFGCCDFIFASPASHFGFDSISKNQTTFAGGAQRLVGRLGGPRHALLFLSSGRRINADDALRMGLVDKVSPNPAAAAKTFVEKSFEQCNWNTLRANKEVVAMVEQDHLRQAAMREQFNFRGFWMGQTHQDTIDMFQMSM